MVDGNGTLFGWQGLPIRGEGLALYRAMLPPASLVFRCAVICSSRLTTDEWTLLRAHQTRRQRNATDLTACQCAGMRGTR